MLRIIQHCNPIIFGGSRLNMNNKSSTTGNDTIQL